MGIATVTRDHIPVPFISRRALLPLLRGGAEDSYLIGSVHGSEWRDFAGQRHRSDGPAQVSASSRAWWSHGLMHRSDGPAFVTLSQEHWYLHGVSHRDGAPARHNQWGTTWFLAGQEVDPGTRLADRPDLRAAFEDRRTQHQRAAEWSRAAFDELGELYSRHAQHPCLMQTPWQSLEDAHRSFHERPESRLGLPDLGRVHEGLVLTDVTVVLPFTSDADALFAYSTTGVFHHVGSTNPQDDALATTVQLMARRDEGGVRLECVQTHSYLDHGEYPALNAEVSRAVLAERFPDVTAAEEYAWHSLSQLTFRPQRWAPPPDRFSSPKL